MEFIRDTLFVIAIVALIILLLSIEAYFFMFTCWLVNIQNVTFLKALFVSFVMSVFSYMIKKCVE